MDEWRQEWRRVGVGMIAAAFALWVGRLSASEQVVVPNHGKPYELPDPNHWLIFVFLGIAALCAWVWLATWPSTPQWVWAPGKLGAAKADCQVFGEYEFDPGLRAPRGGMDDHGNELFFERCTCVFLTVKNTGGTADFAAEFSNATGIQRGDGKSFEGHFAKLAWEAVPIARQTIGAGGRARLVAMLLFREPVIGWFHIPHVSMWSGQAEPHQMSDWKLVHSNLLAPIEFDVQIINETKMTSDEWQVVVDWGANGEVHGVEAVPKNH